MAKHQVIADLPPKQRMFALEWMVDRNATQAAIRAGYPKRSASVTGAKLMKNPKIQRYLERELAKQEQRVRKNADDVLDYLDDVLDLMPARYFENGNKDGWVTTPAVLKALPDRIHRLITEVRHVRIEDDEGGVVEKCMVRFFSKEEAMKIRAKYTLTEKHDVSVSTEWDSSYPPPQVPSNIVLELPKGDYTVGELYDGQVGDKHDVP